MISPSSVIMRHTSKNPTDLCQLLLLVWLILWPWRWGQHILKISDSLQTTWSYNLEYCTHYNNLHSNLYKFCISYEIKILFYRFWGKLDIMWSFHTSHSAFQHQSGLMDDYGKQIHLYCFMYLLCCGYVSQHKLQCHCLYEIKYFIVVKLSYVNNEETVKINFTINQVK
jgi:hypothetical protein